MTNLILIVALMAQAVTEVKKPEVKKEEKTKVIPSALTIELLQAELGLNQALMNCEPCAQARVKRNEAIVELQKFCSPLVLGQEGKEFKCTQPSTK